MEENKFTKGPWHVYTMGNYFGINSGSDSGDQPDDRTIVTYGDNDDDVMGVRGDTYEEMKANACLIAAAPDMYEALKAVVRHGLIEKDGYESVLKQINFVLTYITQGK
jgi:hypothetical protein